jgi:hypothetical protein
MKPFLQRSLMLLVLVCAGCDQGGKAPAVVTDTSPAPGVHDDLPDDPVLVGAGDIAGCWWFGDTHTGQLIDGIPGTVFTLGDNVYQAGSAERYRKCYDPVWGRFKDRTFPSIGNHDTDEDGGAAYFDYFGGNAGPRGKGYYSYDLGAWHIVVFNSSTREMIADTSAQIAWIRQDLAEHPATTCVLAYGHNPRFGSGERGAGGRMRALWNVLYAAGADVMVAGHEHFYERFAPQDADGRRDDVRGIRQFIAGTGGAPYYPFKKIAENSEVRSRTHGVLKLVLHRDSYEWEFIPSEGLSFSDRGRGRCSAPVSSS